MRNYSRIYTANFILRKNDDFLKKIEKYIFSYKRCTVSLIIFVYLFGF